MSHVTLTQADPTNKEEARVNISPILRSPAVTTLRTTYLVVLLLALSQSSGDASSKTPEQIFAEVSPSVVVVHSLGKHVKHSWQGTGVVVAKDIVVTNCHLFESPIETRVLYQKKRYPARLTVENRARDLCILNVPSLGAPPVSKLVQANSLRVGQAVYAIGTPLGLELTLTAGLISSLRHIGSDTIIQTSASIAPGSSGGGLFDSDGGLVGITTAGISQYQGFNFAIPVDWIAETLAAGIKPTTIKLPKTTPAEARSGILADLKEEETDRAVPYLAFESEKEARAWLGAMSQKLASRIPNRLAREEFLVTAHYEAKRVGLDPQIVLALIQVISDFKKYRVAENGAKGYMQVHPKWLKLIGTPDHNLFHLRTNLRYGCTILRHYLDKTNRSYLRALAAYAADMGIRDGTGFAYAVVTISRTRLKYPS